MYSMNNKWRTHPRLNDWDRDTLYLLDPDHPGVLISFAPYEHSKFKILSSGKILTWGGKPYHQFMGFGILFLPLYPSSSD